MCQKFQAHPLASVLQGNGPEGVPQESTSSSLPRWRTVRVLTVPNMGLRTSIYWDLAINMAKTPLTGMLFTSMARSKK